MLVAYPCVECRTIAETNVIPKVEDIQLSFTSQTYNGKTQKPAVKIFTRNGLLDSYEVIYPKSSVKVGRYTVKITFMNFYSGTVTKTYDITPKGTNIVKITPGKKEMTVKWKKLKIRTYKKAMDGKKTVYIYSDWSNTKTVTVR